MPIQGYEQMVASSGPVLLVQAASHAQSIIIRNAGSTNSVFLGDLNVTSPSGSEPGYELTAGSNTPTLQLNPEEALYGVCGAGLTTRVDTIQSFSA